MTWHTRDNEARHVASCDCATTTSDTRNVPCDCATTTSDTQSVARQWR